MLAGDWNSELVLTAGSSAGKWKIVEVKGLIARAMIEHDGLPTASGGLALVGHEVKKETITYLVGELFDDERGPGGSYPNDALVKKGEPAILAHLRGEVVITIR